MSKLPTLQDVENWRHPGIPDPADERVSIWDIRSGWRDRFWIVFSFQAVLAAAFETWFELQFGNEPTVWHQTRSIISNTMPYIVLIGPASYLITEVSLVLSERYLAWRRKKSRMDFYAWVDRWNEAIERGEDFDEEIPGSVDLRTMAEYAAFLKHHRNGSFNGVDAPDRPSDPLDARERRVLEVEAWYGRKRLAEDRGEAFNEPYPGGNGMSRA